MKQHAKATQRSNIKKKNSHARKKRKAIMIKNNCTQKSFYTSGRQLGFLLNN
jgi:hypothetical protein